MAVLYHALSDSEIRLLHLLPGTGHDRVCCSLQHVELSKDVKYEALSYRWGDGRCKISMNVDGTSVEVNQNLHSFLIHNRSPDEIRILWIDALCINQDNKFERSQQVRLMDTIYSMATTVLVWLGKPSEGSNEAIGLIDRLPTKDYLIYEAINTRALPAFPSNPWKYLAELLVRDYFQRIWIIQEVALAKRAVVICGDVSTEWWKLHWAATQIQRLSELQSDADIQRRLDHPITLNASISAINAIEKARQIVSSNRDDSQSVLTLLARHRISSAKEAYDHIYGLYGLVPQLFRELEIYPNYEIEITALYRKCALAILTRSENLDVLSIPRHHESSNTDEMRLPSWVPDWSRYPNIESLLNVENSGYRRTVRATNDSHWEPQAGSDPSLLSLESYSVDEIMETVFIQEEFEPQKGVTSTSFWTKVGEQSKRLKHQGRLEWSLDRLARVNSRKPHVTGQDKIDILCETKCAGDWEDGWDEARDAFRLQRHLRRTVRHLYPASHILPVYSCLAALHLRLSKSTTTDKPEIRKGRFRFVTYDRSVGRQIFRTKAGYIGLGPSMATKGDQIMLCKGGKLPLVLRFKGQNWELIGDCYIYGMAKGELWDETKCEPIWLQ